MDGNRVFELNSFYRHSTIAIEVGGETTRASESFAYGVGLIALVLSAYAVYSQQTAVPSAPAPVTREFVILAVEYKGTAGANESIPQGTVASAYGWNPAIINVNKGDKVVLKIFGINGNDHPTSIVGPGSVYKLSYKIFPLEIRDGKIEVHKVKVLESPVAQETNVDEFHVYRGHLTVVEFVADKAGIFKLFCRTHQPTMLGWLIVTGQ